MSTTKNYGLHLTPDTEYEMKFLQWRKLINGEQPDSNMQKIDQALGELDQKVPIINDDAETYKVLESTDIDATLTESGKPADAKTVGDALASLTGSDSQTAKNADRLGGKPPEAYTAVNLLDNPDFAVAQAGHGGTHGSDRYAADRWLVHNRDCEISYSNALTVTTLSDQMYVDIIQKLPVLSKLTGIPLTAVIQIDGSIVVLPFVAGNYAEISTDKVTLIVYNKNNTFIIRCASGVTVSIAWAALYEGSFTAETLPPYVPTHPRVENLKIGNAVQPPNLLDNPDFAVAQAGYGGTHGDDIYAADRWKSYAAAITAPTNSNGIKVEGGMWEAMLQQSVSDASRLRGKTVTAVVRFKSDIGSWWFGLSARTSNGEEVGAVAVIVDCSDYTTGTATLTIPDNTEVVLFTINNQHNAFGTCEVVWAALYEGSFTADTLPPFVPPDPTLELQKCQQRYLPNIGEKTVGMFIGSVFTAFVTTPVEMAGMPNVVLKVPDNIAVVYNGGNTTIKINGATCIAKQANGVLIDFVPETIPMQYLPGVCFGTRLDLVVNE